MQTCISCMDRATIGLCSPLVAAGGRIAQVHRLGQRFNDDQWIVDTGGACFSPALPLPDETCVVLLVAGTFICRFFLELLPSNYSLINLQSLHPGTRNAKKRFKNWLFFTNSQEEFFPKSLIFSFSATMLSCFAVCFSAVPFALEVFNDVVLAPVKNLKLTYHDIVF